MKTNHPEGLTPRKTPSQARSQATVEAIYEATIQVLLADGARRLTTTRVAGRAGVSVGTMYQYFPHKDSLLYAVLKRHLNVIAEAVESACQRYRGEVVDIMAEALITAFVDAKTASVETSRALYLVAAELDTANLRNHISNRMNKDIAQLLGSAADAEFEDLPTVSFALLSAMSGVTRIVFEQGATPSLLRMLRTQLAVMCRAYLREAAAKKTTLSVKSQ